jgi:hypothetical protein
MRKTTRLTAVTIFVLVPFGGSSVADTIPFDSNRWKTEAREHRVEEHLGRTSLYLKGGVAWIDDAEFTNGTLEFEVAFTGERGFMGGTWRVQDTQNREEFYLRPHQSGNPDANQYTPLFNGMTGWQLYHGEGYGAAIEYPFDEWIHVKIVFSGSRGEVYVSDMERPLLAIGEMKREVGPGKVGLTVSNFAPAHFSNFSYQAIEKPSLNAEFKEPAPAAHGTVASWMVSAAFGERDLEGKTSLTDADDTPDSWTKLDAESTGITNLSRVQGNSRTSNTVYARVVVVSEREQMRRVRFGYSDRVKVFLNGRLLYGGSNTYRSRDYRYLGTIGLFDELYLPLREGPNELRFAVSESFGGWGLMAVFDETDGISVEAR